MSSQDWGFKFEDVDYDPIKLWHGTKGKQAPVEMTRYMAKRLPHAVLKEFESEGHFDVVQHLEEILSELVSDEGTTGRSTAVEA